jgi:hypothetical protein
MGPGNLLGRPPYLSFCLLRGPQAQRSISLSAAAPSRFPKHVLQGIDGYLLLTQNLQRHVGSLQHHLQTLLDSSLRQGAEIGGDSYASQVFF